MYAIRYWAWPWWSYSDLNFKLKTGIKKSSLELIWQSENKCHLLTSNGEWVPIPRVVTNLTEVGRIYDCLSPLRHSRGRLIAFSWLSPKHQRTGNYTRSSLIIQGTFDNFIEEFIFTCFPLLLSFIFTASTQTSGYKCVIKY